MKYEVNMNKTYKDINPVDEWECAYIWNGKRGKRKSKGSLSKT